jgi:type I restriction enzyme S subunit
MLPSLCEASTYPNIRIPEYLEIQVPLPSIEEQIAIASILSDMDSEIDSLESKLAKAREIKQGMMQELLTGKTRLV